VARVSEDCQPFFIILRKGDSANRPFSFFVIVWRFETIPASGMIKFLLKRSG